MKWLEYPTARARREDKGGELLEGQAVAAAPGGGQWTVTPDRRMHRVKTSLGMKYCIAEEDP